MTVDITETVYGIGGYDPTKPNNNATTRTVKVPIADVNRQALADKATQALATNLAYLGVASPTATQTTAQVKALTRQSSALIRLVLGLLDDTTGT